MSISTLIRRMTEAGAPPEAIAIAVEEIEAIQEALDSRRAADRDRKRLQRERLKLANVTGQSEDSHGTVTDISLSPVPPLNVSPGPPSNIPPLSPIPKKETRGTRISESWVPKPLTGKTAEMVAAWPSGMIERELAKFKDHWLKTPGARGRSLDWDASYRNWLRNADERKPINGQRSSNSMGRHQPTDGISSTARAALAVFGSGQHR